MDTEDSKNYERERVIHNINNDIASEGLRVKGVSKFFGNFRALNNVHFEVDKGELLSILGHNGAGKSTLINIIIGLLGTNHGDVYIKGHNTKDSFADLYQQVGICPQFDILWDDLTAAEHLSMYCKLKGIPYDMID